MKPKLLVLSNDLKPPDTLEFLSQRGIARFKNFYEAVHTIHGSFNLEAAKKISQAVGPYALSDILVKNLKKKNIVLKDGIVPFAAPMDSLEKEWLSRCTQKSYTVLEIKNFFEQNSLEPLALYVDKQSLQNIQALQRVELSPKDIWNEIEMIDALECHLNPALYLSSRRVS